MLLYVGLDFDKDLVNSMQMALQDTQPIDQMPSLGLHLWDYQRAGIAKIIHCWQGPYQSCILGDEMGLGKTIQAIAASILDPDTTPASFSLIITTKTCGIQWLSQIKMHFNEVSTLLGRLYLSKANLF